MSLAILPGHSQAQQSKHLLSANRLGAYRESTTETAESCSEPDRAGQWSTPGSVSMVVLTYHQVTAFFKAGTGHYKS
jgi:hypothetical protein